MPYGPFQSPYICVAIWPVPKQKQNLFFTNKTKINILTHIYVAIWPIPKRKQNLFFTNKSKTNILYIKKSPFQKTQMTYALNYVLYDIGSWHTETIIKSFVL